MDVGNLRHRVTIRAPIGVLSETDPVDVATSVPMEIEVLELPFQQREQLATGGLNTSTIYRTACRYRTDIQPSYVLVEQCCTQRTFQIVALIPKRNEGRLDLTCVTSG